MWSVDLRMIQLTWSCKKEEVFCILPTHRPMLIPFVLGEFGLVDPHRHCLYIPRYAYTNPTASVSRINFFYLSICNTGTTVNLSYCTAHQKPKQTR